MSPIIDDCPNSRISMVTEVKRHEQFRRFHHRGNNFNRVNSFELWIGAEGAGGNSISTAEDQSSLRIGIEKDSQMSLHLLHIGGAQGSQMVDERRFVLGHHES